MHGAGRTLQQTPEERRIPFDPRVEISFNARALPDCLLINSLNQAGQTGGVLRMSEQKQMDTVRLYKRVG